MRRFSAILLVLLASPSFPQQPRHGRVVLLSVDAASDAILDRLLASGKLANGAFDQMRRHGFVAASVTPSAVSSTPVSHPTIFSGTWPGTHGVTGVALPGQSLTGELRSGFNVPTSVDRLWNVVQNAGKRVVCIAAPGAEATSPSDTCTETVTFNSIARPHTTDPGGLLGRLEKVIGTTPGAPNGARATAGEMSEDDYVVAEEQFAEYVSGAVKAELNRDDWDLLIVYIPLLDGLEHRYLLSDPRQVEFGDEHGQRRERFARFIERGYRKIDSIVSDWLAIAPSTDFVVVSDHGMMPTHSIVLVNNALASAGLAVTGPTAQVLAISSGASVQVYINSKRRFSNGVVDDADVPPIEAKVVSVLKGLRDPETSRPVFPTILVSNELGTIDLAHANAGDVYASAAPGWGTTGRFDPDVPLFVPNTLSADTRKRVSRSPAEESFLRAGRHNELSLGVHGQYPGDPRIQAVLYAIGPHVPHATTGVVPMIDIAPSVLWLLDIKPPSYMTGRNIFGH
jgi:predicted AlkP superfamily phosphohydrolase/phosphomutase